MTSFNPDLTEKGCTVTTSLKHRPRLKLEKLVTTKKKRSSVQRESTIGLETGVWGTPQQSS